MYTTSTTRTVLGEFSELQYSLSPSYQADSCLNSETVLTFYLALFFFFQTNPVSIGDLPVINYIKINKYILKC